MRTEDSRSHITNTSLTKSVVIQPSPIPVDDVEVKNDTPSKQVVTKESEDYLIDKLNNFAEQRRNQDSTMPTPDTLL
mgnify:CR=1 FL=1